MIPRVTALLACALFSILLLTAYRVAPEEDTKVTVPVAFKTPKAEKHFKCDQKGKRAYIASKRERTWHWQDLSYIPRTRSSMREKHVRGCAYLNWLKRLWQGRAHEAFLFYAELREPQQAICHVFGIYCSEALRVARCESGHAYSVRAQNGQYLGMFQMGDYARSRYGHGYTPLEQARAAYAYFADAGYDWSPWSCKP